MWRRALTFSMGQLGNALLRKITLEERPDKDEGASPVDIWKQSMPN